MKPPKATRLPSGSWNVRMRIKGREYSITKATEAEAVAEAMAIRAGLKQPDPPQKSITLANAIDAYIEARRDILSASSVRGYQIIRRNRFRAAMGMSITHMSKAQWQAMINLEARDGVAPKTIRNSWGLIASVLKDNGLPVPDVRLPAQMPNKHPYLTPNQIEKFVDAIKGQPVELAALLGLHSLRRSEICGLTWKDIDLQNNVIRVRGAVVFNAENKQITKRQTKNASSTREIPIIIDRLAELLAEKKQTNGSVISDHPNTIYKRVNRICKEHGLPLIGAHGLRHSFASLCKSKGVPEETTMLLGGWSDFQTMRKHYTHFSQEEVRSHVDSLRDFFQPKINKENADKIADDQKQTD